MGIEPTRDLIDPTLVLKTRSATRRQSPPENLSILQHNDLVTGIINDKC